MRFLYMVLICAPLLFGCYSEPTPGTSSSEHTLIGNPRIPVQDLRTCFPDGAWDSIKDLEYDGYVIIRGFINSDKTVDLDSIVDYYPDDSRNALAWEFAQQVILSPTRVGTNTTLHARIYLIFYENPPLPRKAILFAQQYGVASTVTLGERIYMRNLTY